MTVYCATLKGHGKDYKMTGNLDHSHGATVCIGYVVNMLQAIPINSQHCYVVTAVSSKPSIQITLR